MAPPLHLSFSACGFLGVYHLGAAATLRARGRGLLRDVTAVGGASGGAVVATVLLTAPGRIEVRVGVGGGAGPGLRGGAWAWFKECAFLI